MELIDNTINNLAEEFTSLGKEYLSLEKAIPALDNAFGDQAKTVRLLNKEIGALSKTSASFKKQLTDISAATGFSLESQLQLISATKEYHKLLDKEVTKSTLQFQKATGASIEIVGKLSAHLKTLGVTDKVFEKMYKNILSVRDAYGLTSEEVADVSAHTIKYANIMGVTGDNTAKAAKNIAIFTSKLKSAGVETSVVSKTLNDMLDPDKITENLMLFSKMGLTMSDLTIGDPTEKLVESLPKLKKLGMEITSEQNRIVASQMAQVYGITLETARELSRLDTSKVAQEREKELEAYRAETESMKESLSNIGNSIAGSVSSIFSPYISVVEQLMTGSGPIMRGLGTVLIGAGLKGIGKLLGNLFEKPVANIKENVNKIKEAAGNELSEIKNILYKISTNLPGAYASETQLRTDTKASDSASLAGAAGVNSIYSESLGKYSVIDTRSGKVQKVIDRERSEMDTDGYDYSGESIEDLKNYLSSMGSGLENEISDLSNKKRLTSRESSRLQSFTTKQFQFNDKKNEIIKGLEESKYFGAADSSMKAYKSLIGEKADFINSGKEDRNEAGKIALFNMLTSIGADASKLDAMSNVNAKENEFGDFLFAGGGAKGMLESARNIIGGLGLDEEGQEQLRKLIENNIEALEENNKHIKEKIKKAQEELDGLKIQETVDKENKVGVLSNLLGGAKSFLKANGKKLAIGGAISAATAVAGFIGKSVLETEGVKKQLEEFNEKRTALVDGIKKKVGNFFAPAFEGILGGINKILPATKQIEENTSGYNLKEMTLAYATAESYKNNEILTELNRIASSSEKTAGNTSDLADSSAVALINKG